MTTPSKLLLLLFSISLISQCKKASSQKGAVDTSGSTFVTNSNGFEFVGSFEESQAPIDYQYPRVAHIDDYDGNDRMVIVSEKSPVNPPKFYKWYVCNYKDGKLTQTYTTKDGFGDNDGSKFSYVFDHPSFTLETWYHPGSYYWELKPDQQEIVYIVSAGSQFPAILINHHLLRRISEVSWWPYHTNQQKDEKQFLLTGELSAMKAIDYFFDNTYETEAENSIYTGYFYPSNDGNWIGIGKGNVRLDTLLIDNGPSTNYNLMLCNTYIEKIGNKIFLAFIKNKMNPNTEQDLSMFELTIGENILKPLFTNMSLPPNNNYQMLGCRNGKLYFFPNSNSSDIRPYIIDKLGTKTFFDFPVLATGVGTQRMVFGKRFLYLILNKDLKRIEIYKKDLMQ